MSRWKHFSDGCFIPIRMHKVLSALGLRHNSVEHMSSLKHDVDIRRLIVVHVKYGTVDLMLALKEMEIKL